MLTARLRVDIAGLERLEQAVPRRAGGGARRLAERTAEIVKSSWSLTSPSSPGTPPAVVTGTLDASVGVERQGNLLNPAWAVVASAPHSGYLEVGTDKMAERPYMAPALAAVAMEAEGIIDAEAVFSVRGD